MANPTQVSKRFLKPEVQASLLKADTALQNADKVALQALITAEASARAAGDTTNANALAAEITRAMAAEAANLAKINQEISDRQAAVSGVSSSVSAELTRAQAAESALGVRIDGEVTARQAADSTNASAISAEVTRAMAAEAANLAKINQEISDRQDGDTMNANGLTGEITRAQAVEVQIQTQLDQVEQTANLAIPLAQKGAANGVAPLNGSSLIDASFLPSYVDDVLEFATLSVFPSPGEQGKIYVDKSTSNIFRWSGTVYIEIAASPGSTSEIPEGTNLYFTDARAQAAVASGTASAVAAETSRAQAAESALGGRIDSETSARSAADASLRSDLNSEISARQSGDSTNASAISAEVTRAQNAEAAEQSRAMGVESGLRTDLNSEISARQNGDLTEASARAAAVSAEQTRAMAAEAAALAVANAALPKAGGTMSGDINMNGSAIKNLLDPVAAQDAATKAYVLANGAVFKKELFVLQGVTGQSPTNMFLDLQFVAKSDSFSFISDGLELTEGAGYDYTVDVSGGVGGKTRINFEDNLKAGGQTPLIAGDVVVVKYGHN